MCDDSESKGGARVTFLSKRMELRYILPRSWTDCVLPTIAEACQSLAPGAAAKEGCGVLAMAAGGEFEGLRGKYLGMVTS